MTAPRWQTMGPGLFGPTTTTQTALIPLPDPTGTADLFDPAAPAPRAAQLRLTGGHIGLVECSEHGSLTVAVYLNTFGDWRAICTFDGTSISEQCPASSALEALR